MKKAIFAYNPVSGNHSIQHSIDQIIAVFQGNGVLLQPFRLMNDSESVLISILTQENFDFIVVSGGDGTVNSVINLLLKNDINMPIGLIPGGTCNDFARSLGIGSSIQDAIDVILEGSLINVDVGQINNNQYFLSSCAGGRLVDVSYNVQSELKRNFGPLAYYLKAISEVAQLKSFRIKVKTELEELEEEVLIFIVLNGKDAAGLSNVIWEADLSDGMMDIMLIKNCRHIDLAALFFKVISNEKLNNKHIRRLTAKWCSVESSSDVAVSVDGEKGPSLPIRIQFINNAIRVFSRIPQV